MSGSIAVPVHEVLRSLSAWSLVQDFVYEVFGVAICCDQGFQWVEFMLGKSLSSFSKCSCSSDTWNVAWAFEDGDCRW